MKAHPSGRPIYRAERRDYPMRQSPFIGFRRPRLNDEIRPRHDTHAVGFITLPTRDDLHYVTEARRK